MAEFIPSSHIPVFRFFFCLCLNWAFDTLFSNIHYKTKQFRNATVSEVQAPMNVLP